MADSNTAQTFVLVPGAWLGSWSWQPVARLLAARGYQVLALTLPGLSYDGSAAGLGLADAIDYVVNEVQRRDLADVILVGHSWGGYPVTGAAHRVADRVSKVIYFSGRSRAGQVDGRRERAVRQDHPRGDRGQPRCGRLGRPRRDPGRSHARRPCPAPGTRQPAAAAAARWLHDRQPRPARGYEDRPGCGLRAVRRRRRPGTSRHRVRGAARRRPAGRARQSHGAADTAGHRRRRPDLPGLNGPAGELAVPSLLALNVGSLRCRNLSRAGDERRPESYKSPFDCWWFQ
ncbi:MAG: alpha/beta hydrolase [Acidobacteriaceae bacterium]|nr:alpha/beta hydrolase [Acidobacteriaceae bacterium]